jgi:VWFA-related protein
VFAFCISQAKASPDPQASADNQTTSSAGFLRILAVSNGDSPVTDLKPDELRLRINKQDRKVLSISSSAASPKTIGIFVDASGSRKRDILLGNEVQVIIRFLGAVWHDHDVGFVVTFNDDAFTEVNPTSDLPQIANALRKLPSFRGSTALYDSLCSVRVLGAQTARGEKLFVVLSDFSDNASHRDEKSMIKTLREQGVRLLVLLRHDDSEKQREAGYARRAAHNAAQKTGGDVFLIESEKDLEPALQRLINEVSASYFVNFDGLSSGSVIKDLQIDSTRPSARVLYAKE